MVRVRPWAILLTCSLSCSRPPPGEDVAQGPPPRTAELEGCASTGVRARIGDRSFIHVQEAVNYLALLAEPGRVAEVLLCAGQIEESVIVPEGLRLHLSPAPGAASRVYWRGEEGLPALRAATRTELRLEGIQFEGGGRRGRAITTRGPRLFVEGCTFSSLRSSGDGGAILVQVPEGDQMTQLRVEGSTFRQVSAEGDGGAISVQGAGGPVDWTILNSTLVHGSAGGDGGLLSFRGDSALVLRILDSQLEAGAARHGGSLALSSEGSQTWLVLRRVEMVDSSAEERGGHLYHRSWNRDHDLYLTMDGNRVEGGRAQAGGAFWLSSAGSLQAYWGSTEFLFNRSESGGAALDLTDPGVGYGYLIFEESVFRSNSAASGAAIAVGSSISFQLRAEQDGGGNAPLLVQGTRGLAMEELVAEQVLICHTSGICTLLEEW